MFQITQYLQYRNTPDNKPRVLVEGVDYNVTVKPWLELITTIAQRVANLSDCRPLLSVEIDGVEWTELDIWYNQYGYLATFVFDEHGLLRLDKTDEASDFEPETYNGLYFHKDEVKLGSFFDDPAKYSKLLWNSTEEEGWKKVFELLKIVNMLQINLYCLVNNTAEVWMKDYGILKDFISLKELKPSHYQFFVKIGEGRFFLTTQDFFKREFND
jgi:hypothetical protein